MVDHCPYHIMYILSRQLVKNAIRASHNIIQLLAAIFLEVNFRVTYDNIWVSTQLRLLGFQISEGPAYGEAPGEYPVWANKWIIHGVFLDWRFFDPDLLQARLTLGIDD